MKYCRQCGVQMADEAVLCVACGCMVDSVPMKKNDFLAMRRANEKKESEISSVTNSTATEICSFVHAILIVVASFFLAIAWIFHTVYSGRYGTYVSPDVPAAVISLLFGFASLVMGTLVLIFVLRKKENLQKVFSGIVKLSISFLLCLLSVFTLSL